MSAKEAEKAVASLEELARRRGKPGHHLARSVLLALGQARREEDAESCARLLERARAAGNLAGPPWREAVQTELTLACGEFAQGVDPRYLGLPNYDLEYTRAARGRLADRLEVARELGFGLEPREAQVLELADRVLAQHLAARGSIQSDTDQRLPRARPPSNAPHAVQPPRIDGRK